MTVLDPITGPLPREKLQELVAAPFGQATKVIQKYDPQWGRASGEKFEWEVTVERAEGVAYVMAASKEEAVERADDLDGSDIEWEDFEVVSVEPRRVPHE